ncbi:MAG: DUF342 domain-containing protein [Burkholderiales bacterium]|nr:DUF342 domain-containing protein [Burkholderiales bacterium]
MPEDAHLQYLSFRLDKEAKKIIAAFAPEGGTDTVTLDALKKAIAAAGFGDCRLDEQALKAATAKYATGKAFEIQVGEAVDGKFEIRIDTHHLNAYLSCTPAHGGAPVTLENVVEEAARKEITAVAALDQKAIQNALQAGGSNVLIAKGKAPVNGVDARFESLVPSAKERSPRLDEHGLADFRELGEILMVRAGDPLMRRIPATDGEPGFDLSGKPIPAKPGKNIAFSKSMEGTALDPANENLLIAAADGCPVLLKDGVTVESIYTVEDVDLRTGNIDFLGTVNVKGGVQSGMTVKASGDIHINDTVEGVVLLAGGDVVVKGGIVGLMARAGEKAHQFTVNCKGSCTANFTQNARISAGTGIFIRDSAMQCELTAGHQIIVGDKNSRKGHLVGGTARAMMLVKAQVIGSPARAKTIVIAGADKELQDRLASIAEARDIAINKLMNVVKLLEVANSHPERLPADTVKAAETTRDSINAEMIALTKDEDELNRELALSADAQVVAEKEFLEGVEVQFGAKRQKIVADREAGVFQLSDGELVCR